VSRKTLGDGFFLASVPSPAIAERQNTETSRTDLIGLSVAPGFLYDNVVIRTSSGLRRVRLLTNGRCYVGIVVHIMAPVSQRSAVPQ